MLNHINHIRINEDKNNIMPALDILFIVLLYQMIYFNLYPQQYQTIMRGLRVI